MLLRPLALLVVLSACGGSPTCRVQLEALATEWYEAVRELDRSCTVDNDCVLVSADFACSSDSDRFVLNVSSAATVDALREQFDRRCPGTCRMAGDSFNPPVAAYCHAGVCTARRQNDP
jgi:hypothetical protein